MPTETVARAKLCPIQKPDPATNGRPQLGGLGGSGSVAHFTQSAPFVPRCVASDCMMWRWHPQLPGVLDAADDEGYCGLAGSGTA